MNQKFDDLKKQIQDADKSKVQDIIQEVNKARLNGEIDENEKNDLVQEAKNQFGDLDLGSI